MPQPPIEKKKLSEVFKTVGLPPYTYVRPSYYGEVRADIEQPGKHLLIEGPSGIGKTCIVYKVFEDIGWVKDREYQYVSGRDPDVLNQVNAFLTSAEQGEIPAPPMLVIDDFHLLPAQRRVEIGSILKRLSDRAFEWDNPPKAILIGIPTTGATLLSDAYDLGPRLGAYRFTRANDEEIDKLISEGEAALNIRFEDRAFLLAESEGNFWLAQFICNKVCATQEIFESQDDTQILTFDLLRIRQRLMAELSQRYMPVVRVFAKGKKWRPGGNKPYLEVLLALAKIPDLVVTYDKILNLVTELGRPGLKAIRPRIAEVIYDPGRDIDLRKQIAFDPGSGFSIEDPLFRYYLSNLNSDDVYQELGVEAENLETSRLYSYDVGFSFAGEVRRIVEAINEQLKAEDVVTFYDYDQQAVLLALDLEPTLRKIYAESCRYYLVFLEKHYLEKVWTKYERDVLTHSNRKEHIIPIVLDEVGSSGAVGITSTIGRVDLREQWTDITKTGVVGPDVINTIRNRCVLPLLEKLDTSPII
jgi:hypothetical protein